MKRELLENQYYSIDDQTLNKYKSKRLNVNDFVVWTTRCAYDISEMRWKGKDTLFVVDSLHVFPSLCYTQAHTTNRLEFATTSWLYDSVVCMRCRLSKYGEMNKAGQAQNIVFANHFLTMNFYHFHGYHMHKFNIYSHFLLIISNHL